MKYHSPPVWVMMMLLLVLVSWVDGYVRFVRYVYVVGKFERTNRSHCVIGDQPIYVGRSGRHGRFGYLQTAVYRERAFD